LEQHSCFFLLCVFHDLLIILHDDNDPVQNLLKVQRGLFFPDLGRLLLDVIFTLSTLLALICFIAIPLWILQKH